MGALHSHVTRHFMVWNTPHHVTAKLDGTSHQLTTTRIRKNTILGERYQLQMTEVPYLLTHLDHGTERRQLRVAHIHVTADVQRALRDLPENGL